MKVLMPSASRLSALTMVLASATSGFAWAQATPAPLVEAARKAVLKNPEVQARWNGFLASGDEREVARGGLKPRVDLTASAGRERYVSPVQDYGTYKFGGGRLTLSQMLFDGGFTRSEVQRLGYARLVRWYELAEATETASLEAVRAYADTVRYRELVAVAKENYAEHLATTQLVEERAKSGVGRRVDVEQANGRLALAESNLLTEVTNLHDVSARYLRIVGEKPPKDMPPLPENFRLGKLPASVSSLMAEGLPRNPAINAAFENVRAANQSIETRRSAYQPRVDVRAYQSFDRNSGGVVGPYRSTGVEVVLNFNLYRGGSDSAAERQAVHQKHQARDLQEKACRDVRQTLAIAYSDSRSLLDQQRYQDAHRLATEKSREAYRQQFQIGQRTLLDLLDSQNEYFEATRAYINTRHNQIVAQTRVLAGMGQLVGTLGVSRSDIPSAQDAGQDRGLLPPSELCPYEDAEVPTIDQIKAELVLPPRPPVARPAPAAPAPPPAAKPAVVVRLSADVLFDFDKSELRPEGVARLDEFVGKLKASPFELLIATGHTDAMGTDEYNEALSLRRAGAVRDHLVSRGIDGARVRVVGKGESQPIAENDTPEGRQKNRRVEIEVVPPGSTRP
jgi:adhesin transport system outer membrane protein